MTHLYSAIPSLRLPSPLIPFTPNWDGATRVEMLVKRDDAIHPIISGNKWRKLKYALRNLPLCTQSIVSFGGGHSNHLHALGFVCRQLSTPFHAIVRGNYLGNETPMLKDLALWGSHIHYVDKKTYQQRHSKDYLAQLARTYPKSVIIPEGGSQADALKGIGEMVEEVAVPFDRIMVPVASGATLAGIALALDSTKQALGIAVLKGEGYLESLVTQFIPSSLNHWQIDHRFHCGGYAKQSAALATFCDAFNQQMPFCIEPVYSGKVFFALKQLLAAKAFHEGERIVIVHTGGLQGARRA
ncbi:1-aminocyclopropane-1-carboxylate deaminase/D-cysteine desulfhydrase [Alteromonas profundi]|uniref:1-aminocyclopropane-1-carboxylate deaminase/D-cysteine desulfhydrase n=1 Tax=Alteromonas profundi TaxID=2696062 RepID=UPI0031B5DCC2